MSTQKQITAYINSQPQPKRSELQTLHQHITKLLPKSKLWIIDGKNSEGKVIANPNIGYGSYNIQYADGTSREFYQIGLSGNTTGISVYIMGLKDKTYLAQTFGKKLGKASVTGYCIKFKSLQAINMAVLSEAILYGVKTSVE